MTAQIDTLTNSTGTGQTRIQDVRWLRTARIAWVIIAVVAAVTFLIGITYDLQAGLGTCSQPPCPSPIISTLRTVDPRARALLPTEFWGVYFPALDGILFVVWFISGCVLFWLRSDDWIVMAFTLALVVLGAYYGPSAAALADANPNLRPLIVALAVMSTVFPLVTLLTFPSGRFAPRWTRWVLLIFPLWEIMRVLGFYYRLPFYVPPYRTAIFLGAMGFLGVGVYAQVYRYRRLATPTQRQQSKWFVLGVAGAILGHIVTISFLLLFNQPAAPARFLLAVAIVRPIVEHVLLILIPFAVGFAIFRYRLWDVDLVINRSLVFSGVTVLLALVFFIGLLVLNLILGTLLGDDQSTLAAMISTAVVIALFQPTRRRVRSLVDRRLYGFRFDLHELRRAQRTRGLPPTTNPGSLTGNVLSNYQLLDVIGKGGMGEVYKGFNAGHTVAIKILPPEQGEKEDARRRFEREALALAALEHPNIVKIHGSGVSDNLHYLIMEYIDGVELADYLRQHGALPYPMARSILADIAAALDYVHLQGLVHRDIKPSNIMLQITGDEHSAPTGRPYKAILMDFGIAKLGDSRTQLTGSNAIGTIDYMSPEQIMSAQEVDKRADIYALGVVSYEMLTGQKPFRGNSAQVLFAHIQQPPPDPRDVKPGLPPQAAHALLKALAKQPDARFQSAGEFVAALS